MLSVYNVDRSTAAAKYCPLCKLSVLSMVASTGGNRGQGIFDYSLYSLCMRRWTRVNTPFTRDVAGGEKKEILH